MIVCSSWDMLRPDRRARARQAGNYSGGAAIMAELHVPPEVGDPMSKRLPFLLAGAAVLVMLATIALRWHRASTGGNACAVASRG